MGEVADVRHIRRSVYRADSRVARHARCCADRKVSARSFVEGNENDGTKADLAFRGRRIKVA
jgi:hypothetical protein